jgi:peptide/nickel transport system permease protein
VTEQSTLAALPSQENGVPAAGRSAVLERGRQTQTPTRRAMRKFFRHRLALIGLVLLSLVVLLSVFAPLFAGYDYAEQDLKSYRKAPSAEHVLGTDTFGRDVWSRLLYGGRVSLQVGIMAVAVSEFIAIVLGSLAGYYRGKLDDLIMRAVDVVLCFPTLMVIIFIVAILGPSLQNTILVIGLLGWPGPTRLVRGQILSLREMDYVTAARSLGVFDRRIIFRHVLPGVLPPLIVHATFGVAGAILTEAGLSFLGLGIRPPEPSWGNMLSAAQELVILEQMAWLWLPPGLAIMLAVLSINFIGDGLRDALDPRQLGG